MLDISYSLASPSELLLRLNLLVQNCQAAVARIGFAIAQWRDLISGTIPEERDLKFSQYVSA
jgi:hypothetical protein